MTELIPDAGPDESDEPYHIQWLRARARNGDWPAPRPPDRRRRLVVAGTLAAVGVVSIGALAWRNHATTASAGQSAPTSAPPSTAPSRSSTAVGALATAAARAALTDPAASPTPASTDAPTPSTTTTNASATTTVPATVPTTVPTTVPPPGDANASNAPAANAPAANAPASETAPPAAAYELLAGPPSDLLPGGQPWPHGLYVDSQLHMQGTVPSREIADAVGAKIAAILGPESVVDELEIDPSVPLVKTVLLRLGPLVLFEPESDVIRSQYLSGFDLMAAFLAANPDLTLTIIGYTDGQGEPSYNLRLAGRRAEAARARIVAAGIDPDRVDSVARGTSQLGNNLTSVGRAQNRRIEFAITGIFG